MTWPFPSTKWKICVYRWRWGGDFTPGSIFARPISMKLLSFGPMIFLSTMPGPIPFSHGSAGRLRTIAPMILSEGGAHSRVISILRGYVLRPDLDRVRGGASEPRFRRVEVRNRARPHGSDRYC